MRILALGWVFSVLAVVAFTGQAEATSMWAQDVVADSSNDTQFPIHDINNVLGAPDGAQLGLMGGTITLTFGANTGFNDKAGADFNLVELWVGEPRWQISASQDGSNWFSAGITLVADEGIDGVVDVAQSRNVYSYDMSGTGLAWARYIRLVGTDPGNTSSGGADLDGVGVHEVTGVPEPSVAGLLALLLLGGVSRSRRG